MTPASSLASCAAAAQFFLPFMGQPFGITHRLVSREVSSSTCASPSSKRIGSAATWVSAGSSDRADEWLAGFMWVAVECSALSLARVEPVGVTPVMSWFQKLLPREDKFFDLFERHSATLVSGARALRQLLDGGPELARHAQ